MAEVFDGLVVGVRCCPQWWRTGVVGEVRQASGQESVVHAGQEMRGVQALVGHRIAVAVRDALDEAAGFESTQVIGDLSGGERCGR